MKKMAAVALGFTAAPMVSALIFSATTPLATNIKTRIELIPPAYLVAAVPTLLFALPAFAVLLRLNLVRWWSASGVGFAIGALMGITLLGPTPANMLGILFMGVIGIASGLAFWIIWSQTGEKGDAISLPSSGKH